MKDESLNFCFGMYKCTKKDRLEKIDELLGEYIVRFAWAVMAGGDFPTKKQINQEAKSRKELIAAIDTLMMAQK